MINKNDITEKSIVMIKFIMKKIKNLVIDSYGQLIYIENVDNVIYDVYGYKHLVSRINDCRSNKEHLALFVDFGIDQLIKMTNTPSIYSSIDELVQIDARITELERNFKKAQKKGKKKDKDQLKEYEYIKELYKDAIKKLRKQLNIVSRKKQYKKKYSALNSLVNRKYNGIGGGFYDDDDDDIFISKALSKDYDFYDDDEDDDDELSSYMEKHLSKKSKKKVKPSPRFIDDDDEFYDDDDEDDEDDDDDDLDRYDKDDIISRLDIMSDNYSKLASFVQQVANTQTGINQSDAYVIENYLKNRKVSDMKAPAPTRTPVAPVICDDKTQRELTNLKKSMGTMERVISRLAEDQDKIVKFISEATVEEDDDEEEEFYADSRRPQYEETLKRVNQEDGPFMPSDYEIIEDDGPYTREQMISMINSQPRRPRAPKEPAVNIETGAVYIGGVSSEVELKGNAEVDIHTSASPSDNEE